MESNIALTQPVRAVCLEVYIERRYMSLIV